MLEFHSENSRLNGVQAAVVAFHLVVVLLRLAVITEHSNFTGDGLVIRGHSARFATGAKIFPWIKTKGCSLAHRTSFTPPPLSPRIVLSAVSLAGVLDHHYVVF